MTPRERYMAVLAGGKADYLPRLPILMAFAARFIGSDYGRFASDYKVLVEANRRCAEYFDFDQLSAISDPFRETQGFGAEIEYVEDGVPRCLSVPLENDFDLSRLTRPDPHKAERMKDRLMGIEAMKQEAQDKYSILGWIEGPAAEAAALRTVNNFLVDLMTDPDKACDLMDLCAETGIDFARAQIEGGADTIGIGDAIASQVAPETYRDLIFPREKRLVDAIHEAGGLVRLHICGDTTHLLDDFAKLGCDIVDLDWQVNLCEARRILGPDQCLVTNLNPVAEVMASNEKAIHEQLKKLYGDVRNPLMIGAGCEIPRDTPAENLKALCEPILWREN
jgi:MtaA/CmuA family methyltransferase